jgi:ribonucleotide reductase beta subunit family protein with ferritin-like domain
METAVDYLEREFKEKLIGENIPEWVQEIFTKAKEMEKEYLCDFYNKGAEAELNAPYVTNIQFYNKVFNSTKP